MRAAGIFPLQFGTLRVIRGPTIAPFSVFSRLVTSPIAFFHVMCILTFHFSNSGMYNTRSIGLMRPAAIFIIQGVSRLVDITAGGDFLGLCDEKCSYKHVSDFGRLRSYGHFLIPVYALV